MKKLIIILNFIVQVGLGYTQSSNTDVQLRGVSIVQPSTAVGGSGFVEIEIANNGKNIPTNGLLIQMSTSRFIDFGVPQLVDDYGVWKITYTQVTMNNTNIFIENKLGPFPHLETYYLKLNFTGAMVCCVDCGASSANATLTDDSNLGDPAPQNNGAYGLFTVTAPLPITLVNFDVENQQCQSVALSWTTLSEVNFKEYEVEKSLDGKNFVKIGRLVGGENGNVQNDYKFYDTNIGKVTRAYYRLKSVDLDGTYSYSPIKDVTLNCDRGLGFSVYPNPAFDKVNVTLQGFDANEKVKIIVTNAIGEVVMTIPNVSPATVNTIKLDGLTAGIYNVKVIGHEYIPAKRFIKVDK